MCVLPTDVVVTASLFGLDMSTIMWNFPSSFFGMTAMLLAITPEHSKLGNGPAIYILLADLCLEVLVNYFSMFAGRWGAGSGRSTLRCFLQPNPKPMLHPTD